MQGMFIMIDIPDTFYMLGIVYLIPGWVRDQHGWLLAIQGPADQVCG